VKKLPHEVTGKTKEEEQTDETLRYGTINQLIVTNNHELPRTRINVLSLCFNRHDRFVVIRIR